MTTVKKELEKMTDVEAFSYFNILRTPCFGNHTAHEHLPIIIEILSDRGHEKIINKAIKTRKRVISAN